MSAAPARAAAPPPGAGPRAARAALAACLIASLAGCGPATGDFGRPAPSVVHDDLMPAVGDALARARREPVSSYPRTDDERLLRDLGWAVVMPPLEAQRRERAIAELRRTRILPANRRRFDKSSYVKTLLAEPYRSSEARYARLKDDVVADTLRIDPFFQVAARVAAADRARGRAVETVPEVQPGERADALARIEENGLFIAWVRDSFDERLVSYRYALDRLILATPDRSSIEVEGAIDAFEDVLASLRPLGPPRGVFKG
ncbi:hypothetical protein [Hansschlegelia sp.]|uniref:hypothetical protein n=1 Tax=Hansschlegelia sp. TaxID=2041892 RepID=UPI002D01CC8B|nr:hypothetical protein [Hansschlegelia sp.]HVI28148.1 hypothetical protein [Hansschlegelia sp.]